MASINGKRVVLGGLAGAVAWSVWTSFVTMGVLSPTYVVEEKVGHVLGTPRYGFATFFLSWFFTIFIVSGIAAWLYAVARPSLGAGPKTALMVGATLGFAAGFPLSLTVVSWLPVAPTVPLFWMLDAWVGIVLAALIAAYIYKDK